MPATPTTEAPVVVIGAGPHGLSAAALLRDAGVPTRTFGEPLGFWRTQMPPEMMLRSSPRASSIESPARMTKLSHWAQEHGREIGRIVSIGDFIAYGQWFAQRLVPDLDERLVADVRTGGSRFVVTLVDGEEVVASRVVVGTGLAPFAHVPPLWREFDAPLVTHTAWNAPSSAFAGQRVAIIGAGQSALEAAAILSEAGAASVEVLGRGSEIFWLGRWVAPAPSAAAGNGTGPVPTEERPPEQTFRARHGLHWRPAPTDVGGRLTSWVGAAPDVVRRLPRSVRTPLTSFCIRPAGAFWLPDRLRSVTITLGVNVSAVTPLASGGGVELRLDDGSMRAVDRVVLGTGYAIDVRRYPFLGASVLAGLRTRDGSPLLGRGLESSVPGLHFTGAPAAESFGPVMRFVVGTSYTGPAIVQAVLGRARPRFRWAF